MLQIRLSYMNGETIATAPVVVASDGYLELGEHDAKYHTDFETALYNFTDGNLDYDTSEFLFACFDHPEIPRVEFQWRIEIV